MKYKFLLPLIISLLFGFKNGTNKDDINSILLKLSKANSQKESLSYAMLYNLYAGPNYGTLKSSLKGNLIQKNGIKYCQLGEIESVQTEKYFVAIDRDEKVMMLSNGNRVTNTLVTIEQLVNYSQFCETQTITKVSEKESKLSIKTKAGEVSKFDVLFDPNTYLIKKICLYYAANNTSELYQSEQKLEIVFMERAVNKMSDPKLNMANYCYQKNGKWYPNANFKGYEFINNLYQQ